MFIQNLVICLFTWHFEFEGLKGRGGVGWVDGVCSLCGDGAAHESHVRQVYMLFTGGEEPWLHIHCCSILVVI